MQCPIDGTQLVMTDRNGVEIDYCPQCRGVWLDRGELDKIIERNMTQTPPPPPPQHAPERSYDHGHGYDTRPRKKKKRDSFLSEIFDF
ncbi:MULTISPECIES: zf-TFIIB domain-containing protein [unclassified Roseovarius]|uniref:TFIIB-type zinc ribbon-containing protein n=1 Tax=unclassified Roseovarius TaxID=2614913 RepID=UPI00273DD988|nr:MULTISPECIES: zf-TFIIB domain-containing protein [unclassified Roseovarius]